MTVPAFVGRDDELAFLRDRLAATAEGRPQTVLVVGPGGVGKSALLAAFTRDLGPVTHLRASGDEAETFLSYGVLRQLLESREPPGGEQRADQVTDRWSDTWRDPFAAGADLLRFLDRERTRQPVLFVVDDAHLADTESLTALSFALRRLHADRVMAVFTVGEQEAERVPPGLVRLVDAQDGRLRLTGLTEADVVRLGKARGRGQLTSRAAARLRRHTDGSPLHLTALLDELTTDDLNATAPLPAPQSYAMLVLRTLASQSEDARKLARAAAVLADDCPVEVAGRVGAVSGAEEALEELTRSRLVNGRYDGRGWLLR